MNVKSDGDTVRILRRIAKEAAQLPLLRTLARPLHRRLFARQYFGGNSYCGVFPTFAEAKAQAPRMLPSGYDAATNAGDMYRFELEHLIVSEYPVLFWLGRLFEDGQRRVFDLGGHIGIKYYVLQRYLAFPEALRWRVHDVPTVIEAGRRYAETHDERRQLSFAESPDAATGHDMLLANGSLQYLDYSLDELLRRLPNSPAHVLVNMTPMHPQRSYFTLQHIGIAVCPYRIQAVPEFVHAMQALGYTLVDHWASLERNVRVPFHPECDVERYHGFYFRRAAPGAART